MTDYALDPVIHAPTRLKIVATLAVLPAGDAVSFLRLQDMLGMTAGSLTARVRELDHAGYVQTEETGDGRAQTAVALTRDGRAALDRYQAALRRPPRVAGAGRPASAPAERVGDAERDAAAAALAEHFAQGRLALDELITRLEVALTATTYDELSQAIRDLPAHPGPG